MKNIKEFKKGVVITVNDSMQKDYTYILDENPGENFAENFTPYFTPQKMLELGVFEGKYCNDCINEFPQEWFENANISKKANINCNFFKIKSRQSLSVWKQNGWIIEPDPRGWFQWYCRYYLGRRIKGVDEHQIKRWKAFSRHAGQIKANYLPGALNCRPKQRQALLQWSHDPFI